MKHDFERLRAVVPMDEEVQKQTTMSLLHKARILIRVRIRIKSSNILIDVFKYLFIS